MAYFMWRYGRELHSAFGQAQACFSELNEKTQEGIGNIRLVKAFGYEARQHSVFAQSRNALRRRIYALRVSILNIDLRHI